MVKNIKLNLYATILSCLVLLILSLLICTPLSNSYTAYANSVTAKLSSQDQTIHRGQTFDVDIDLAENTGILTLFLTVKFDHNIFTLIDVQQVRDALGELNMAHSGSGYDYIDERTGGFNLLWDGGSRADSHSGTAVRLTFQSSLTAPMGTYPIELVVDEKNTTIAYEVPANIQVTSPQITLIEGAFVVVWHDWNGMEVPNTNITGHPYNQQTGGYEYSSEESLNVETDFPNNPSRAEDDMYSYEFSHWEGAVWRGEVPEGSSVIYYVAKYTYTPKIYVVWYYVDGYGEDNSEPDGEITEEDFYTVDEVEYNGIIKDTLLPRKNNYTFYGWFTDSHFKNRLTTPLMPAHDIYLYGYFKYNIRETDIPTIQLVYRETVEEGDLGSFAYVDVYITRNYGLSSLFITLAEFDTDSFTFCGFEKGEIFRQMSFESTNYTEDYYPQVFNFSWNNSYHNSYEIGRLLILKFRVNPNAESGAYEVIMTSDNQNTTYVKDGEIWYSNVEFINTKLPIGRTNHWVEPISTSDGVVEVESPNFVPYNVELVVVDITNNVEKVIDSQALENIYSQNLVVHSLYDIFFQQNETRLTQEQYRQFFGDDKVTVRIKLSTMLLHCSNLSIYFVDDEGQMHLYNANRERGYLVFQTDHFSNWALVGDDVLVNVETSSAKLLRVSLILFGISASALISIAFVRNRKKQSLVTYSNQTKGGNET